MSDRAAGFWIVVLGIFLVVVITMGVLIVTNKVKCEDKYIVMSPQLGALAFGVYLDTEEIVDMGKETIQNYYWYIDGKELRIALEFTDRAYTATPCVTPDVIFWRNLEEKYYEAESSQE